MLLVTFCTYARWILRSSAGRPKACKLFLFFDWGCPQQQRPKRFHICPWQSSSNLCSYFSKRSTSKKNRHAKLGFASTSIYVCTNGASEVLLRLQLLCFVFAIFVHFPLVSLLHGLLHKRAISF